MLLVAISSMLIEIAILLMHYKNHYASFTCQYNNDPHTNCVQNYVCKLVPINGEKYHTFVPAFIRYTAFIILSCLVVIVIDIIDYVHKNNSITPIFNYILMYQVLTISIWESAFTFVRYYATRGTTQFFGKLSTTKIYRKFMIYAVLFSILYLLQIHICYWILPILVSINIVFNIYYNHRFAAILLKQYNAFQFEEDFIQIVRKVKLLQNLSIVYGISQCVSLTLFIMTYSINNIFVNNRQSHSPSQPFIVNTLSYLVDAMPLFWCISTGVYAISFVRNQKHFQHIKRQLPGFKIQITVKEKLQEAIQEPKDEQQQTANDQQIKKQPSDEELSSAMPSVNNTVPSHAIQCDIELVQSQSAPIEVAVPITMAKLHNSKSMPIATTMIATSPPLNSTPPICEEKSMDFHAVEALDLNEIENSSNNISFEATLDTLTTMKSYGFLPQVDTIKALKSMRKTQTQTITFSKCQSVQLPYAS